MKRKKISTIFSLFIMIAVIGIVSVFTIYSFIDKNTESDKENRALAKLPEISVTNWFNGTYAIDLNSYMNDHVLMRNMIIDKASGFESLLRKNLSVQIMKSNNKRKDIGSDALVLEDRILALYINNQDYTDTFIRECNKLFELMPENVNKYMMLSPSRIEFEEEEAKQYSDSQLETIYGIYYNMDKDVKVVDSYSLLQLAAQYHGLDKLYFKTDHHWTAYGASFGASALLVTMGKEPVIPERYTKKNAGDFKGYLYVMHAANASNIDSEPFIYYECADGINEYAYGVGNSDITESIYEPVLDETRAGYYIFVERSYQYVVIEGGNSEGGNLLMINDSYGNAMVPWMADQFNTIVMIDPRTYEGGQQGLMELVEEYEITDFALSFAGLFMSSSFAEDLGKLTE
ncbi:MAG: DHHW family protein [Butyrivibrio sp.]